jgi:hypothetical protein
MLFGYGIIVKNLNYKNAYLFDLFTVIGFFIRNRFLLLIFKATVFSIKSDKLKKIETKVVALVYFTDSVRVVLADLENLTLFSIVVFLAGLDFDFNFTLFCLDAGKKFKPLIA